MKSLLIINTGTPVSYKVSDIRKYLAEFLMDSCVIDLPFWKRWLLVHGIILRVRPRYVSHLYKTIWTNEGSPLRSISAKQSLLLRDILKCPVEYAFRYSSPSIEESFASLLKKGCHEITVLPLFPQYSLATVETIYKKVREVSLKLKRIFPHSLEIIPPFWNHPAWIESWCKHVKKALPRKFDHCLITYHGLPEKHILKVDLQGCHCLKKKNCCESANGKTLECCYRAQTIKCTRYLTDFLGLKEDQYTHAYQSRFGRGRWLQPYAVDSVRRLATEGIKDLVVVNGSFVTDCLETRYEIEHELKEVFIRSGGKNFNVVPCMNEDISWVEAVCESKV